MADAETNPFFLPRVVDRMASTPERGSAGTHNRRNEKNAEVSALPRTYGPKSRVSQIGSTLGEHGKVSNEAGDAA
jgi:hypothetical protein